MACKIAENPGITQPDRNVVFVIQDCLHVSGDIQLLRIALENLLGNAWKFTSNHSAARIEFNSIMQDDTPLYYVRDDGAGFDMKYADKLFSAFHRLHSSVEFPGSGIGLATVQRIIHRHGGEIRAAGELEKGAVVYFTIREPIPIINP